MSSSPSAVTSTTKSAWSWRTSPRVIIGAKLWSIRWPAFVPLLRSLTKGYTASATDATTIRPDGGARPAAAAGEQHARPIDQRDAVENNEERNAIEPADLGDAAVVGLGSVYPLEQRRRALVDCARFAAVDIEAREPPGATACCA